MSIHPSSVISKEVELGKDVVIGPFCVVRGRVKIGDGTVLDSHVSVGSEMGIVEIGKHNRICAGAAVGGPPQDLKYKGEPTKLIIGDHNMIREMATLNIGTPGGGGVTRLGSHTLIMAYSHIAHDCQVGDHVVIANTSQLAGHVIIEEHVKIGGMCAVSQFCRVGKYAYIAGDTSINKDILPFSMAQGKFAVMRAANTIGMERSGFSKESVASIKTAIRIITKGNDTVENSIKRILEECKPDPALDYFLESIRSSTRGIAI